jgi:hypothetical protein
MVDQHQWISTSGSAPVDQHQWISTSCPLGRLEGNFETFRNMTVKKADDISKYVEINRQITGSL